MIFVTVGNATQGFHRLLNAVDRLAGEGLLKGDEVLIQAGKSAGFRSSRCKVVDFLAVERFVEAIREADLVICHAGAGTLFHIFQSGKVPVVMPRRKLYGEHVDDHQLELAEALAQEGRIIQAYEPQDLSDAVTEARARKAKGIPPSPSRMLSLVAQAIEELMAQKAKPTAE